MCLGTDGCSTRMNGREMCNKHYLRWWRHGDVNVVKMPSTVFKPKGLEIEYRAAHNRVQAKRGKATDYSCVDCTASADSWSYDHTDSNELTELRQGRYVAYSVDIEHYEPRCFSCHTRMDKALAK